MCPVRVKYHVNECHSVHNVATVLWTVLHSPSLLLFSLISSILISSSLPLIHQPAHASLHHILSLPLPLFMTTRFLCLPVSVSLSLAALRLVFTQISSTSQVLLFDSSCFRHSLPCHLLVIPPPHSPPFSLHPLTC